MWIHRVYYEITAQTRKVKRDHYQEVWGTKDSGIAGYKRDDGGHGITEIVILIRK